MLSVLRGEGQRRGYIVYGHGGFQNDGEWLLDCIWWYRNADCGMGIGLACESEWNDTPIEVSWDFQKLLCVKAPLKLLIYSGGPDPRYGGSIREQLDADLLAWSGHASDDEYLFMSFDVGGAYAHRVRIEANGRLRNVNWELIHAIEADWRVRNVKKAGA